MSSLAPESAVSARAPALDGRRSVLVPNRLLTILLTCALGLIGGCRGEDPDLPYLREPLVAVDAHALDRALATLARLEETPIARLSRATRLEWTERTDCDEIWLRPASEANLGIPTESEPNANAPDLLGLECGDDPDAADHLAQVVRTRRGNHDGLLLWPLGDDGRLELRFDVDAAGGIEIDGSIVPPASLGALALAVPAEDGPAPPAIAPSSTLFHLRVKPRDGIRLASLLPADGQADRLFALKGRLLEGALLSGTFELAMVPPAEGGGVPLLVGALHHRHPEPIRAALSEALDHLEATWPIQRSDRLFTRAGSDPIRGGCYANLPLLPELAPCWTVTEDALLMGWRAEAVEAALAAPQVSAEPTRVGEADRSEAPHGASRLDVYFDRLAAVDRRLSPEDSLVRPSEVFSKLELRWGSSPDGSIHVHALLGARP